MIRSSTRWSTCAKRLTGWLNGSRNLYRHGRGQSDAESTGGDGQQPANASTPWFRAQLNALRAVPVEGLSLPTRTLVVASTPGADMTPGQMDYTSRPLDVALQQDGWLAVQTADGSEGYTRNGAIQVSPTGELTIQWTPGNWRSRTDSRAGRFRSYHCGGRDNFRT